MVVCNQTHMADDLYDCHNYSRLKELNDEKALQLLPVTLYLTMLMIAGIFGNLLVWYVYYFRFKKTPSNYFVLWLASLDLVTCVLATPFEIVDVTKPYTFDMHVACKTLRFLESVTTIASGLTLVAVAFDRYRKVFKPFKRMSNKRAKLIGSISFVIAIVLAWPAFFIYGSKHVPTSDPYITGIECSVSDNVKSTVYPKIYSGLLFLVFIVTVLSLIVIYGKLGTEIRKRGRLRISQQPMANGTGDNSMSMAPGDEESSSGGKKPETRTSRLPSFGSFGRSHKVDLKQDKTPEPTRTGYNPGKTTKILFCVSFAFVLSFLPHVIVKVIQAANKGFEEFPSVTAEVFYNLATRSFLLNGAVNPFIYSCLNEAFRKETKGLFQRCFKRFRSTKV